MDSDYFTYIIRSNNKDSSTDNTNSCKIMLNGLPTPYQYFQCEVISFNMTTYNSTFTDTVFELRCDLNIVNGYDTNTKSLKTVGITTTSNILVPISFRCENFNNRSITFNIYNDSGTLLQFNNGSGVTNYNLPWKLILKIKGIK